MPEFTPRKAADRAPPAHAIAAGAPPYSSASSPPGTATPFQQAYAPGASAAVLVGESPRMQELHSVISRLAASKAPVLISGEAGAGKTLVAKELFRQSPQVGPLLVVSAQGLSAAALDAKAREADRGGLVITGVEALEDDAQRMLLGVLDRLTPRIFATTTARLEDEAKAQRFRPELLYRIQVLSVRVPPLSERAQDLGTLWASACAVAAREAGKSTPPTSSDVMGQLHRYSWPGNVQELETIARRAVFGATSEGITMESLPEQMTTTQPSLDEIRLPGMRLRDLERIAILKTYAATGSAKATAEMLDISVRKVHYRLKEYRGEGDTTPPNSSQAT